jgi:hypothetical protein
MLETFYACKLQIWSVWVAKPVPNACFYEHGACDLEINELVIYKRCACFYKYSAWVLQAYVLVIYLHSPCKL